MRILGPLKKSYIMKSTIFIFMLLLTSALLTSCSESAAQETPPIDKPTDDTTSISAFSFINEEGMLIKTRFNVPEGYKRIESAPNTWESFLQNLPLKAHGAQVKLYDGTLKSNTSAYLAVVDLPIGNRNLHQCADAIMRLRADYFNAQEKYSEIEFLFVSGNRSNYKTWLGTRQPNAKNYWAYLENVFNGASTLSLDKQLIHKEIDQLQIGDVFIKGGSPGHAVIVVDKCTNAKGEVKFMLAQSFMPAQEIQILVNPASSESPWYDLNFGEYLNSAEYTFTKDQLKRF
jgi:hypothetical protein